MKKQILSLGTLAFFTCLSFTSCNEEKKEKTIETNPISFKKEAELYLLKSSGDTIEKLDIELAESDYEHETGLMYRDGMEDSQGMLFIYDSERVRNYYMKNTYFPLDIIYYAEDSSLVSIQKNATPREETSLPSDGPAQYVLEVNAGLSDEWNLEKGDKFTFYRTNSNEE
ncbi:DUF192 domain-containing protein [Gramella jeungdoensis]|uniref:DUF192 domain-containing protein n=1 Tax=Gramella jeungdoensis TaxID=708091 RepID=A0ABT0YWS9_9FLAO|nr:DUF192 domain-containing protein [Gramella jeungdoensis]MCM8567896.1 DUF192 domain-containing protein [Gramella jeungdoensis]